MTLRPANPDGLKEWRQFHAAQDERFAKERADDEQQANVQLNGEIENLRAELGAQIAALRAEVAALRDAIASRAGIEAVGEVIGEVTGSLRQDVSGQIEDVRKRYLDLETELFRRFGEVMGRLDAIAPDTRSKARGEFRFAGEKNDDVVELPNPFAPGGSGLN